jgi:hypothetical protein
MMHATLRAATVAAALLSFATAQEPQPRTGPGQRMERPHPRQEREPGSQPGGETRPRHDGDAQMTPEQRARRYMDAHPEVKQQLFEQADANGDGKLDDRERETMRKLVEAKMKAIKEERAESRENRQEQQQERAEARRNEMQERADRNGDGRVGPRERERAQEVREQRRDDMRERADRNADGRVGPRERERAQEVREQHRDDMRERADRNEDGRVGPRERERAQEVREQHRDRQPSGDGRQKPRPRNTQGRGNDG